MAIFRINKTKNYTVMSNYHLKDKNLSLKAKGLLSLMLSLPEDWDYSVRGLEKICKESKDTINNILKELEKYNYLKRTRIYCNGKISEWEYNIYENPIETIDTQGIDLHPKKQDIEKQDIENKDVNKKTKEIKTKQQIIDEQKQVLLDHFTYIWNEYPNKKGKAKAIEYYLQWTIKGRNISGTNIQLTDEQVYKAVVNYKKECEKNHTETQYIKHADTFFNKAILDYVEDLNE